MSVELDAAIHYAELGLPVFPLHPIVDGRCGCGNRGCDDVGKHPIAKGWQNSIASVPAARSFWRDGLGDRGIGLACGPRAGCFGFDVDPRHGGDESLARLVAAHGKLPRTWAGQSGRGEGLHLFFAYPEDGDVHNSAGKVGPGLDVRGVAGYMVIAPSLHASGNRYRWLVSPDEASLAPATAWLLERVRAVSRPNGERAKVPATMVPAGMRHDALVSLLGVLKR